jgi:hypothetical protein
VERGWKVNILEDARHSSVLYIGKYFVVWPVVLFQRLAHPFADPRLSKNMKASSTSFVLKMQKIGQGGGKEKKLRR